MAYRRKSFRRRRPAMRWFTPNLWNASAPQPYASLQTTGLSEESSNTAVTNMVYGSAPFPGVVNAAGLRAGTMLAERQYYNIKRIVGRMKYFMSADEEVNFSGCHITVWWAVFRMNTDEDGQPDAQALGAFPALAVRDNQDDKKLILAQDVWRTVVPAGGATLGGHYIELDSEPPLYSLIDKTMKRSFRNEQDIFLATQFAIDFNNASALPPTGTTFTLKGTLNLRMLGVFGR